MTRAWFVVPGGIDDPERVSGGNVYDRHVRDGLRRRGWELRMCAPGDRAELAALLTDVAVGELVLIDGLVAGWDPGFVETLGERSRVIVLAHMVVAAFPGVTSEEIEAERRVLAGAERVIATSPWTAAELTRRALVESHRLFIAAPGSRPTMAQLRAPAHHELLCVGVIAPHKGHDVLLDALSRLTDDDWVCTVAGSRSVDPDFAASIAAGVARFDGRVRLTGVLVGEQLDAAYHRAGLLVAPSRVESFGMAIADAQRLGLPVIASDVGGIPGTVAAGGAILVAPGDPVALAEALQDWMSDPTLRVRLRAEAAHARSSAPRWTDTVARVDEILAAA